MDASVPLVAATVVDDPLANTPAVIISESESAAESQADVALTYSPETQLGSIFDAVPTDAPISVGSAEGSEQQEPSEASETETEGEEQAATAQQAEPDNVLSSYSSSASSTTEQLIETLRAANGPPASSEIYLRIVDFAVSDYLLQVEAGSLQILNLQSEILFSQQLGIPTVLIFDAIEGALHARNTFTIDQSVFDSDDLAVTIQGDVGNDTLRIQSDQGVARQWNIDSWGGGAVGNVLFSRIENLIGAAGDDDTFVIGANSGVSGQLEGGTGGLDKLVFEGGSYATVAYEGLGQDAGVVHLDGRILSHAGLESIRDYAAVTSRTFTGNSGSDHIRVHGAEVSGLLVVESQNSALKSITFAVPINSLVINSGEGDDTLSIGALSAFTGTLIVDGGGGNDALEAADNSTNIWRITGLNSGLLNGQGFREFENLRGGGEDDTFIFESTGRISDLIEGGALGFDTLVLAGGPYNRVAYAATGPDSGWFDVDGVVTRFSGLEPTEMQQISGAPAVEVEITDAADQVVVRRNPVTNQIVVEGRRNTTPTFESFSFPDTISSLLINLAGGNDRITVEPLNITTPNFTLTIQGMEGEDRITLGSNLGFLASATVNVRGGPDADTIEINSLTGAWVLADGSLDGPENYTITLTLIERAVLSGESLASAGFTGQTLFESGLPQWIEQGPTLATGSYSRLGNGQVNGAVQTVATHPTNANIIYAGTVNGGVWKTTTALRGTNNSDDDGDGSTDEPDEIGWTPLTDQFPSLAINAITLDLDDASIIYAGTGSTSSLNFEGGVARGLLKSTDEGQTWQIIGEKELRDRVVTGIVAKGNIVVVTASGDGGLYRSTNGGNSFTRLTSDDASKAVDGITSSFSSDNDDGDALNDEVGVVSFSIKTGMAGSGYRQGDVITANVPAGGGVTVHRQAQFEIISVDVSGAVRQVALTDAGEYDGVTSPLTVNPSGGTVGAGGLQLELSFSANEFNLPGPGVVSALMAKPPANPGDPLTLYAAFPGLGIFRSTDDGVHWLSITGNMSRDIIGSAERIRLAVSGNNTVYVAVATDSGQLFADVPVGADKIRIAREDPFFAPFAEGDTLDIIGTNPETVTVDTSLILDKVDNSNPGYTELTLTSGLKFAHVKGDRVVARISGRLAAIYKSGDQGKTWLPIGAPGDIDTGGIHHGGQANRHFSFVADPSDSNVIYVGGDTTPDLHGGILGIFGGVYTGQIFRYNGTSWSSVVNDGANDTAPHPDSRNMVFDAQGNIIEVDDGGIVKLESPGTSGRRWKSLNGMGLFEFSSVAYDALNNIIIGGAQDNGVVLQSGMRQLIWQSLTGGDGQFVDSALQGTGLSLLYSSVQQLAFFKRITDTSTGSSDTDRLSLEVNGTGPFDDDDLSEEVDPTLVRFGNPFDVNAIDPYRFLIGTEVIYEEDPDFLIPTRGDDVSLRNGEPDLVWFGVGRLPEKARVGLVQTIVSGGYEFDGSGARTPMRDIAFVGVRDVTHPGSGWIERASDRGQQKNTGSLWVRLGSADSGFNFIQDASFQTAAGAAVPIDLVVHPDDWKQVYVLDSAGEIWHSTLNTGTPYTKTSPISFAPWRQLTLGSNLAQVAGDLRTLELVVLDKKSNTNASDDQVALLVGGLGGVFRTTVDLATIATLPAAGPHNLTFGEFGLGLPNVLVTDLRYDPTDNLLLAGTLGRGAWTLPNADTALKQQSVLRISGTTIADTVLLRRHVDQPWMLNVFLSKADGSLSPLATETIQLSALGKIEIDGKSAADTVRLDGTNGPIAIAGGIAVVDTGGTTATDVLQIQNMVNDRSHTPRSGFGASVDVTTTTPGGGGTDEVQQVTVEAAGGRFRLTFGGNTTAALPFDASNAEVESELEKLAGITNVDVARSSGDFDGDGLNQTRYDITFRGPANTNVAQLTADGSLVAKYEFDDDDRFEADRGAAESTARVIVTATGVEDLPYVLRTGTTAPSGVTNFLTHSSESEVQGGIEGLFGLSREMFATSAGTNLGAINANSLALALNSELVEAVAVRPKDPVADLAQVTPGGRAQLDLGGSVLQRVLRDALSLGGIADILAGGPLALRDALAGIDPGGTVTATKLDGITPIAAGDKFDDGVIFRVQLSKLLRGIVDLGVAGDALVAQLGLSNALADRIHIEGTAEIKANIDLNVTFGIDTEGFFIQPDAAQPEFSITNVDIDGDVVAEGRFGLLGVQLENVDLTVDPDVALRFDLNDLGSGDGKIRIPELARAITDLVSFTLVSPGTQDVIFEATLIAVAVIPGLDSFNLAQTDISFTWADIHSAQFAVDASEDALQDGSDFLNFLKLNPQEILTRFLELKNKLAELSAAVDVDIPFLDKSFDGLARIATVIDERILSQLKFFDDPASSVPSFGTAQELMTGLVSSLTDIREDDERLTGILDDIVGLDELPFSYNPATGELTYGINAHITLVDTEPIDFGFDFDSGLADVSSNGEAEVSVDVDINFVLGLDLDDLSFSTDALLDNFFIRNASISAAIRFALSDFDAAARFGFLSVEVVDGTASANPTLTINLNDPGTNEADGRIDLRELIEGLDDLGSLISTDLSGVADFQLPLAVPLLGISASPETTISFHMDNVFDPSTITLTLPSTSAFLEMSNFTNMDAGSIVGVLGKLTFWLDEFRRSDTFANLNLPLIGPVLDEAMQLADTFRDLVLIDDNDTRLDDNKTLLHDLNAALDDAGLGRKLFAANVDGKIALIALDASFTSFNVTGAPALGFAPSQSSSLPTGRFFEEAVGSSAFSDAEGNLSADLSFTITAGSKTYEVTVAKTATDDNTTVGDDRWKLINGNNAPTFATAQQMSLRLLDAFGSYPGVTYNTASDTLNFTLDLSQVFGNLNLPLNFDVENLPDFLQLETSGELAFRLSGTLNLEVGVFLGNAEPSDKLQLDTPLAELSDPLVLNDNQRYSALPIVGKLTDAAHFSITADGGAAVPVTVTKLEADNNMTVVDLVGDINRALQGTMLAGKVQAQPVPAAPGQMAPQQIQFVGLAVASTLTVTAAAGDPAVTEIGLLTSDTAIGPNPTLVAGKTLAPLKGRLTANAGFTIALVKGGTTDFDVLLTHEQTQDNAHPFSIINDIKAQLNTERIEVGFSNGALTFTTTDGSAIQVKNVTGTATNELGIVAGDGNGDDLLITVRSGATYRVAFDSGDTTIQDIIDAIETASSNNVSVTINTAGSGLTLVDRTFDDIPAGSGSFRVQTFNNSPAGLLLAIVRADSSGTEGDHPDGIIEGGDIAALMALDRFFVKPTPLGSDPLAGLAVEIGTPEPLTASASFGFVGLGLKGEGGLSGAGITPTNNALKATLTVRLFEPAGSTDGRVSLAELISALETDAEESFESLFSLSLTGQGQINLSLTPETISSLSSLGIDVGTGPRIEITADMSQNVFDGHAPVIKVTPQHFDELAGFGNLDFNFESVLAGLAALVEFLDDFEALSFLNDPIPVIDVSVKDLISIAQKFGEAVTAAQNDPAGTLQVLRNKLLAAFGLPPNSPELNLLLVDGPNGSKVLKIDTQLTVGFSKSLPLNLNLGLDPLEFGGDADLLAEGSLRLDLDFGFDIEKPLDIYVFDSTGIAATLKLAATDLDFKAAVGPLGVFITDGTATINGSLQPALSNKLVSASFLGAFGTSGMAALGDIDLGNDLTVAIGGSLNVGMPVYFPTESLKRGTVTVTGNLSYDTFNRKLQVSLTPGAVGPDGVTSVALADLFKFEPGNLSLLDQLLLGIDGVDLFLEGLQDLLDGTIGGFELPLVGDKLSRAVDVIADFRNGFIEEFRKAIEDLANPALAFAAAGIAPGGAGGLLAAGSVPQGVDPVSKALYRLLGPSGLGLVDSQGDIVFDTNIRTESNPRNIFFDWDIHMGGVLVDAGAGIGFNLGIPGLGLETEGDIHLDIDWALKLGFGINFSDGFYLDIGDSSELQLTARVTTPGLGITGRLGFLQVEGHENVEADEPADDREAERGDTGVTVQFGIDVRNRQNPGDLRLGFSELGRIGIDARIAGRALADLQLALKLNSDLVPNPGNFPSLVADFAFEWSLGTVDNPSTPGDEFNGISLSSLKGGFLKNGLRYVGFHDVGLDLGKYFSDVIGPIIAKVQEVTGPIKPFLDFLTEPIPVISDLAGPTSLLDIAAMSGLVNPGIIKAIEVVDQVVDIVDRMSGVTGTNVVLYFDSVLPAGALVIYEAPAQGVAASTGAGGFLDPGDLAKPANLKKLKEFTKQLNLPAWAGGLGDALGDVAQGLAESVTAMKSGSASEGFKIDIIDDPTQIFGMLMGQPANLVSFRMAPLEVKAEFSAFFSIFGPLGVSINAEFAAKFGPFTFGYDTHGISQFAAGGFRNPLLLFDGLFVGDLDDSGNDIAELQFDAGLWAAAEVNLVIARGGVGGGLFAEIDFNLYDPDHDGKVRIKELLTTIGNEIKYGNPAVSPLAIFDISGKLTAELFWFLKINFPWPIPDINERGQITDPITLLEFENVFTRYPTLATELGNGALQLNIGKNAAARIEGDLSDGKEVIHVSQGSDADHVKVWAPQFGIPSSKAQEYRATSSIIAFAGEGDDEIYFSNVTSDVKLEIYGEAGDDTIVGTSGNGAALLVGGSGDDNLTGGGGDDTLFGGAGSDHLWGKGSNDWLFGDGDHKDYLVVPVITAGIKASDGDDFLYGEDNDDLLVGFGGSDTLDGGADDDVLIGDGGEVTVLPDRRVGTTRELDSDPNTIDPLRLELAVRDTSKTGKGARDDLDGSTGNDHLYGGFGNDDLKGGGNNDVIYGEHGTDTANGGSGDDVVFGDFGVFREVTIGAVTTLEPFITTGGEQDDLSGGTEHDKVLGGAGNDKMKGNDGDDQLWGGIGQDTIWGDNENGSGTGNDKIYGEGDSDKLYGGDGHDYLEGGGGNDLALGGAGEDTLVAGYGSDMLDGEADGDIYRISVRGGPTTELTTAYDTGDFGIDSLIVVGTPGNDTLLLRAMADSYFPTLVKLQGLIDRFFNSTIADRLAAMLQAFNDAYGPWELPQTMVQALTHEYQENLAGPLKAAVQANRGSLSPTDAPTLASLNAIVDEVLASDAASKLDALQKAMSAAYAAAHIDVPNTLFSALTAAYKRTDADALGDIRSSIVNGYVPERVKVLQLVIDEVFADSEVEAPDRITEIKNRIQDGYGAYAIEDALTDLQTAWDNLAPGATEAQRKTALKNSIAALYSPDKLTPDRFTDTAFVAVINEGGADIERFNYRRMEGLVVSTLGGTDYVVLDDLLAAATINLGDGNDRAQIGQVFRSERIKDPEGKLITGITAEDVFTTVEITRGWLSNGVSVPTTINGGDGDDNFTVFRNIAVLNLNGGDGDDVFTVRAFALKGSTDNERARTDMKGDGGADTILYVVNAPVGIDGGDGFDTVRIVGTEFADDFVVTDSGVFGAGLNVTFVNIERLVADGAEGDDRFFIMSTGLEVVTEIDGGLGSDTYFVGGNPSRAPVAVVSNDLRGHSGIILHSVESADTDWGGLPVEGLSANVADDEEAMVLATESNGRSFVVEGAQGAQLGAADTYRLRLSRAPAAGTTVVIAVVPAGLSPEEEAKNFADLELSRNGITWFNSFQVELNASNWSSGVEIMFRAKQDAGYEGRRFTFINHKIDDLTTDVSFFEAQVRSVKVQMEDDDRDGVTIVPSGLGNLALEGGFSDSFQVVLTRAPTSTVNVTLSLANSTGQVLLTLNGAATTTLTFTALNWNVPQTVAVSAVDDTVIEGFHTEYIRFDVSSADREETKGPFTEGQVVKVSGIDIAATKDPVTQKVWLQIDGKIDEPGVQVIPDTGSTFVLLPHRPIAGTLAVRVSGEELALDRFSLTGNTVTFVSASGTPESRTGKVEANYQYKEVGYDNSEVRDQVVDIYDNDTPTVIIQPAGDGMLDIVEGDASATDTYTVQLASAPSQDVRIVIDSVKTRTTWGANAYFEKQLLLSDNNETNKDRITLIFTPANWNVEQIVTVRALDDTRIDGNDTQVFAPDLQTVNKIRGPLIIDGAAGAGSLSLPRPVMLPWELNIRESDGNVLSFEKGATPAAPEYMIVERGDLDAVVNDFKRDDPTFTLFKLVDKTLEMSKGPGTDIVLDLNRPEDKFDRFWRITKVEEAFEGDPNRVRLTLQNPTAVDPTQPNVTAPTSDSEYAITSLSVNFFADEREQVDYLFVYDTDSVAHDQGALTSADGVVLGFDALTSQMTVETSALQRTAILLGLGDIEELKDRKLEITVGPGLGRLYQIIDISGPEGDTKFLTLTALAGTGTPTNRSEFRIEGSDRFGRITGFGMGPNIIFSGRPQGGGITHGDIEVVQVELGRGNDIVRVDYATNSEDHATVRTGDYYTQTILKAGPGNDEITVALTNGDSDASGDGAFALDTEAGNDKVFGAASTRSLVVFGGEGNDEIHTGSGADIVFGDYGRVDYTRKINVQDTQYDGVITRLGSSVPQNPVNPHVTFATDNTIRDSAILGTTFQFPVDYEGLIGLSAQVISPEGHVQFRTILANTADTITVDADWTEFPVYNAADPDDNYYYRVSAFPDDQTDGKFRGPRVIWSVKNELGGDDDIDSGPGQDIVIAGAGDDTVDSDADADWVAGDDARFDFTPVTGNDGPTKLVSILDPGSDGDDTLIGGDLPDLIIGGLGNDTISGAGASDILIGDAARIIYDSAGLVPIEIETIDRANGGSDIIFGQADDDLIIGGSNFDWLDGGLDRDLIFGDNVLLRLNVGSGNSIDPRFRALVGPIIYDANGLAQVTPEFAEAIQPVPGGRPAWADWTITLDQTSQNFGDDYMAGGGGNDTLFGQLGDDTIQGDGSIDSAVDDSTVTKPVGVTRSSNGTIALTPTLTASSIGKLTLVASFEAATDGDDYIEGNGGNDVIFGNLGQDDIIGGSSNLFSYSTAALRPDGQDIIFGGAGTRVGPNEDIPASDGILAEAHARDADAIAGDNANIYRLVGTGGSATGSFLAFEYDKLSTRGPLRIVPRAVELLDYTPGGPSFDSAANNDIGGADEGHGESGDDFIYGMKGNDVLFGDSEDDDLIGGWGHDWISSGTGQDGALGDDGRIFTSRNSTAHGEPLYGIAPISADQIDLPISTPGNMQQAVINVTNALKKTADLTPFNLTRKDLPDDPLNDPDFADDVIYGGLDDDFIHGGGGDDAISGAEAQAQFFVQPANPGNILRHNPDIDEFFDYAEDAPMTRITPFLLNFDMANGRPVNTVHTDGDDVIFGDLGNDWIVGGTGKDQVFGGWGDDLMNMDDDHGTNSGLNNQPDTNVSYEDRAYGGAGLDVLIGNTGGDRLIDWAGEFNSYLVPFAPFGMATVSRALQPQIAEFLYQLSASLGTDPTLASEAGSDPARNGEPFGELGLVRQEDAVWHDQTGAPADPQPGNTSGGKRDVLRSAAFDGVQPNTFTSESGLWKTTNGAYETNPVGVADQVSLMLLGDQLPTYSELLATVNTNKAKAGVKSNAYIIFDYQSATNFKYAGIDTALGKVQIGQRTANGWTDLAQSNLQLDSGVDHQLTVLLDRSNVSLLINGAVQQTYKFAAAVNTGMVGVGASNSFTRFDNVKVLVLPPPVPLTVQESFTAGVTVPSSTQSGQWQVSGGKYQAALSTGTDTAITTWSTAVDRSVGLRLQSTVNTLSYGGLIFDYQNEMNFKFAGVLATTGQIVLGHRDSNGWTFDAVLNTPLRSGVDYQLSLSLRDTSASLYLNDQNILNFQYGSNLTDGYLGLFSLKGSTLFDDLSINAFAL